MGLRNSKPKSKKPLKTKNLGPFDSVASERRSLAGAVQRGIVKAPSSPPVAPARPRTLRQRSAPLMRGGRRRTRRRHRKGKDFDAALKRVIAQHRRYQIARGDKRFKATRGLVKWSRPNKTKRKNRIYYRKRKTRRRRRKTRRRRSRRRRRKTRRRRRRRRR